MSSQPRERASGKYAPTPHSAPEVRLGPTRDQPTEKEIAETLANITEAYGDIERIRKAGSDAFFVIDSLLPLAAIGALVRLGEQANNLGRQFVARHPGPEYDRAIETRHYLAHKFEVNNHILWQTIAVSTKRSAMAHQDVHDKVMGRMTADG
ncbi:DUF86 domain-containing protein [Microbacterium sp. NPDC058389]|uniref:HepT-like ribonuclease domain-containing protein n=1 Tax=Microbacterium sp. NPDC058389 TaxID=3346475 RepID=UPI00365A3A28